MQPKYKPGDTIAWGEDPCTVTHELLHHKGRASSYLVTRRGEAALIWWHSASSWFPHVDRALSDPEAPEALPCILEHDEGRGCWLLGWGESAQDIAPFDDISWRAMDAQDATRALSRLAAAMFTVHELGLSFHGLTRKHLVLNRRSGALYIACAPRLAPAPRERTETYWQDLKLFGELLYEQVMAQPYPGHHEMAKLLQDVCALKAHQLLAPGVTQVVAGCVTPYGDMAYRSCEDVIQGLLHLSRELAATRRYVVGARSSLGNYPFRRNNQDSCAHLILRTICGSKEEHCGFFCVADGVGGIPDGEKASALAVRTACDAFVRGWSYYGDEMARDPVLFARGVGRVVSQRLVLDGEFSYEGNQGATTFSGLLLVQGRAGVVHVGDSRIMLIRKDHVVELTRDHSLANILVQLGELGEDEASAYEVGQRTIARFMSTTHELETSRIDGFAQHVADDLLLDHDMLWDQGLPLCEGDVFVLTSDGAHGELSQDEWIQIARECEDDPQRLCDLALERVLDRVGRDNITVMAVLVGS